MTTEEQRRKIEFNKYLARYKRNSRLCIERIEKAKAEGIDYVKLEDLLVEETWLEALPGELQKPYAKNLCRFVENELRGNIPIYPPQHLIFNALNCTPFDRVKVVIIGQNPNINASQSSKVIAKLEDDIMKTKNNIAKEKKASDSSSANVKKIKSKKISVKDLRFEDLGQIAKHSKRKERKKVYLKVRKNKSMKVKVKEELDFPGRETILFGEVVMAPPKLSLPKDSNIKESQSSTVFAKLGNDIEKTKSYTVMENSVNSESSSAEVKKSNRKRNVLEDIRADDFGQYAMGKERNEEHLKDIRNKYPKVKMNDGKSFSGRGNAIEKAPPKLLPKVPKRSMDAATESLRQKSIQLYRNHRRWDSRPGLDLPSFAGTATL